ncbi:hypothetical protein [Laribacter hongkongensis]|uniref:hypothetical protein n=1 Tax=Laribacter hongkongensis TaxID=168471 RepID=UPI001EFC9669|nr:hypothetical protein [Laribacter hongkongensis]MCG9094338.1 hypothetical protein [Laribacter hongkongensis]
MLSPRFAIVLWTSFWVAGLATTGIFLVIDPASPALAGQPLFDSPLTAYGTVFLLAWVFAAFCAASTLFFIRTRDEVNGYCTVRVQPRRRRHDLPGPQAGVQSFD